MKTRIEKWYQAQRWKAALLSSLWWGNGSNTGTQCTQQTGYNLCMQ